MRLPFIQVSHEWTEHGAADLAVLLNWSEAEAGWGLVKMVDWALNRVPDGKLPSKHDTVEGPSAAKLVARAAHWGGDAEAFVAACEMMRPQVLERSESGIRIRGLNRYDVAVGNAKSRSDSARHAARTRWAKKSNAHAYADAMPGDADAMRTHMRGDAKTQTQTQTHKQLKEEDKEASLPPPPDVVGAYGGMTVPSVVSGALPGRRVEDHPLPVPHSEPLIAFTRQFEKPTKDAEDWSAHEFWLWVQYERQKARVAPEQAPNPKRLSEWWSQARGVVPDVATLKRLYVRFAADPYWDAKSPPCPFAGFLKNWANYVREGEAYANSG